MRATAVAPALVAATLALTVACSFQSRSESFACERVEDCDDGRVCQDGWCVAGNLPDDAAVTVADGAPVPDGRAPDAMAPPDAGPVCPAACTSCAGGTCLIECIADNSCPEAVVCPAGMPCEVVCDGDDSCRAGVECSAATSCDVSCSDRGACLGRVICGTGACRVGCTGRRSCTSGVDCADSCACDVDCSGTFSCLVEPACPENCAEGDECVSDDFGCDRCE